MIGLSEADGVATLRVDHGKVNALDLELALELRDTFHALPQFRAAVLTGNARAFSAGADLRRFLDGGRSYAVAFLTAIDEMYTAAFACPIPVVAAIGGPAIAGGCVLAGAADVRIMSAGTIGLPELTVGVPFPTVTLEIMRHLLGADLGRVIYGARSYDPGDALRVGLVDEVVPPDNLVAAAVERADRLADTPRSTFARIKGGLRAPATERIRAARGEVEGMADLWTDPQVTAALERVLTKR
ncbi:MAG: hypothetical protein JWO69_1986 [Thermoleophilia bacterium]|nr:hypothetical protein [Thermoleophilia bacterium]